MKETKHNLILESPPRVFQPEIACMVGVYGAVMLQQLHYWLERSNNVVDGYIWVYNSYPQWQSIGGLEFWSPKQIRTTLNKLEQIGLVISGSFNKFKADKTKWYRIDYEKLYSLCPNGQTLRPKGRQDISEWSDMFAEVGLPIPKNTTKTTTKEDISLVATSDEVTTRQNRERDKEYARVRSDMNKVFRYLDERVGSKDAGLPKQRSSARRLIREHGRSAVMTAIDKIEPAELNKGVMRWRAIEGMLQESSNNV